MISKSSHTLSEDWCDRGSNPWTPCHKTDTLPVKLTLRRLKKTVLKFPWEIIICPCKLFLPWRTEHISMADLFLIPTIKSGNCSATNPRTVLAATLPKCCVTMSRNLEQNETIGMGEWIREMWRLHNLKKNTVIWMIKSDFDMIWDKIVDRSALRHRHLLGALFALKSSQTNKACLRSLR